MKTALVVGATGLVGGVVLRLLLEDRIYDRVVALVRRPLGIKDDRLEERLVDFDHLESADLAADDVYCALGTTMKRAGSREAFRKVDLDYVRALAERSRACGARAFALVSSVGANPRASNFYLRVKGEAEAAVKAAGFDSVEIMRPSFLVGTRSEGRAGEALGTRLFQALDWTLVGPLRKYRPVRAVDLACAMISATAHASGGVHVYHFDDIWKLSRG
jgi:uncharacterized protein YbjT (DUF2867 family)